MTIEELTEALEFSPQMHEMCCRTDAAPELCQAMTKVQEAARTLLELREKIPGMVDTAFIPDRDDFRRGYNQALTDIQEIIDGA